MRRLAVAASLMIGVSAWPGMAGASGDYGCTPTWSLAVSSYDCVGTAVIGPRNDTRVNLALLARKPIKPEAQGRLIYPEWDWDNGDFGHVFMTWDTLQAAFWPQETPQAQDIAAQEQSYVGTRCQTLGTGDTAFRDALTRAKGLTPDERAALSDARDLIKPACDGDKSGVAWPNIQGKAGLAWLSYLQGAQAFYADDFATARAHFALLVSVRDPWLADTARYMIARNELAAAQANAFDEWGGYAGGDKVDRAAAERGRTALLDYLSAYRTGRYAASAAGLTRRAAWLLSDGGSLTRTYATLMADPAQSPQLIDEVETKVFFGLGVNENVDAPLLLATWDLLRMRQGAADQYLVNEPPAALTAANLAAQAPIFAKQPDLYAFVQASFAYHITKDYRRAIALIPEATNARSYSPLEFSRQMLRALALEKLGDASAEAAFRRIADGARDLYQQPAAQLALAMNWERRGHLAAIFAPASPITEPEIRTILLAQVAGPDLLRQQAGSGQTAPREREIATFTLLSKNLSQGRYGDFLKDLALVGTGASIKGTVSGGWYSGWMDPDPDFAPPSGLFKAGRWQEEFPCPALATTVATLAARPAEARARLCLGEFWRLNGFDGYLTAADKPGAAELGGTPTQFQGRIMPRSALYATILAGGATAPDEAAYALYRSVRCYAPSGNNDCGGADVPKAQRGAWFKRLKREYPDSRWARELTVYW